MIGQSGSVDMDRVRYLIRHFPEGDLGVAPAAGADFAVRFLAFRRGRAYPACLMRGIFATLGTTVLGSLGWAAGLRVGTGTAVVLSAIGSGVGLYWGRRLFDEWLG
jgi:hypothetical protein